MFKKLSKLIERFLFSYRYLDVFVKLKVWHSILYYILLSHNMVGVMWHYLFLFQALEDFFWQSSDMLDRLDDMREDLGHNDFADDVGGAKKGMDQHNELKRKILKIPVETIDSVGQRILQRLDQKQIEYAKILQVFLLLISMCFYHSCRLSCGQDDNSEAMRRSDYICIPAPTICFLWRLSLCERANLS